MSVRCFHCGLPVPTDRAYPIRYENMEQAGCCRGCQAVAQTIIDSGQGAYYQHRTVLPATPQAAVDELKQLGLYDLPEIQASFVRVEAEHIREAALILENIVCAAYAGTRGRFSFPTSCRRLPTSVISRTRSIPVGARRWIGVNALRLAHFEPREAADIAPANAPL